MHQGQRHGENRGHTRGTPKATRGDYQRPPTGTISWPLTLVAERDDSPVTMPFWWWPVDFTNQESLDALAGVEIAQRTGDAKERVDVVNFVRAAANWVPVIGQTLSIATLVQSARENLRTYTSRTSHSVESIVEGLVLDLVRLAADRLLVVVVDNAELANLKTAPLIEALVTTDRARVLVLVAGDPIIMSEQAVEFGDERSVASMCHRHETSSYPLAPLTGRELVGLARTVEREIGPGEALDATGGNPALLAAWLGREPGDPLVPEDVSRNRYWAELARRWPKPNSDRPTAIQAFLVFLANDRSPAFGIRSAAETHGAINADGVIALLDPGICSGLLVATRRDCLEWRCPAFSRFASRYHPTTTRSGPAVSGRDHEPARVNEIVSETVGLAGLLVAGAVGYGPLAARWHAAQSLIVSVSPESTPVSLRLAHGEALLAAHLHPNSTIAQGQALWVTAKAALQLHEWANAVALLEKALALYEQTGPTPEWLIEDLGNAAQQGGHYQTAVTAREELTQRKHLRLGDRHPDTLTTRANLASSYWLGGRTTEAITLYERVVADSVEILGDRHPDTLTTRANLANSYWSAGRTTEAITLLSTAIEIAGQLDYEHPYLASWHTMLADWNHGQ
jgi:Tetratricopeptide repeat